MRVFEKDTEIKHSGFRSFIFKNPSILHSLGIKTINVLIIYER